MNEPILFAEDVDGEAFRKVLTTADLQSVPDPQGRRAYAAAALVKPLHSLLPSRCDQCEGGAISETCIAVVGDELVETCGGRGWYMPEGVTEICGHPIATEGGRVCGALQPAHATATHAYLPRWLIDPVQAGILNECP